MGDPAGSSASLKCRPELFHYQFSPTTPQHSPETIAASAPRLPLPGQQSSTEKDFGGTFPGLTPTVLRSGCRPLHYPTYWLWIEADPRQWSLRGHVRLLGPAGSMQETRLQWKRSVTCNGTRASAPTPNSPDRIALKSLHDPVRVLMTSILCHSVVIVTLFPHVTGGHIMNIAARSLPFCSR